MWVDRDGWTHYTAEEKAAILARTGEYYDRVVEQDDAVAIAHRREILQAEDDASLKILRRLYNGEVAA